MVTIRREQPGDVASVRAINEAAFNDTAEARIVDALRADCPDALSLVAVDGGRVVGHVFFSPVSLPTGNPIANGMGLAPMAVAPDRQRQGIGSQLVRAGIELLHERGCPFIIVVGHSDYYPRFGFIPASGFGLRCQWEGVPDEAFMVLVLDDSAIPHLNGRVAYRDEFDEAM